MEKEPKKKIEPFLTIKTMSGDSGARLECPQLGVSVGAPSEEISRSGIRTLIVDHCKVLIKRAEEGHDIDPEKLDLARKVLANRENLEEIFIK